MHQKDIQEKDPFGQNRRADEAEDDDDDDEKSFLKALLAERALNYYLNLGGCFLGSGFSNEIECPSDDPDVQLQLLLHKEV